MSKARKKRDTSSSQLDWLAAAIGQSTRSAKFVVSGELPVADPGLEVEGLGRVPVPLRRGAAKLRTSCASRDAAPTAARPFPGNAPSERPAPRRAQPARGRPGRR